jgi:hypothetical protein
MGGLPGDGTNTGTTFPELSVRGAESSPADRVNLMGPDSATGPALGACAPCMYGTRHRQCDALEGRVGSGQEGRATIGAGHRTAMTTPTGPPTQPL